MSTDAAARPASWGADPSAPIVLAEGLEILLPSGDGVGPWSGRIHAGEQILLVGPSGSGKSTFLRALAGAIPAHVRATVHGTLRVGGRDPITEGVVALSDTVAVLGQDPVSGVCLPQVADDVALPLENRSVPPAEIGERVERALTAVGAADLADREAVTLSGGQLQRVALAAACIAGPSLLLLDEPTSMLDAAGVAAVRSRVRAAADRPGVASVLVEHRLDDWAGEEGLGGLPGRTIALDRSGHVLADGPTRAVLREHGPALARMGCWLPREIEAASEPGGASHRSPGGSARPADVDPEGDVRASPAAACPLHDAEAGAGVPLLRARELSVGHGRGTVLAGVDLNLRAGRVLAVVGRNGAGKSTLLAALARLDAPQAGSVEGAAAGLVFQRPETQFVGSTVRSELADTGADPERIEAMLQRLQLTDWADASPFRLSGGQQRRLSLGSMLLRERPVLLADEPGFGLDRGAHTAAMAMLRDAAGHGRAVAFTTHDLQALTAADEVAVIAGGGIARRCRPEELLADPELLRTAGLRTPEGTAPRREDATPRHIGPEGEAAPRGGHGPLARRNPTVLLAMLTALSVVCLFLLDPAPLLVLYAALALGVMAGTRIGPLRLLRAQVPFAVFAVGVLVVNVLSRPGQELWPELPIRITEEGLVIGAALALRALVIGLGALAVARAADARRMVVSLQTHAHVPARYAVSLLAGRRLLDELPGRWRTLTRAHRLRLPLTAGGEVPSLRLRRLLSCAFSLLVDAIRSAERIAFALESRGLDDGPRTVWRPIPLGWADALLAAATAVVVTLVIVLV